MRILKLTSFALALSATQAFAADLITKPSAHSVSVTIDRLAAAVKGAGAKIFVAYHNPSELSDDHGIPADAGV